METQTVDILGYQVTIEADRAESEMGAFGRFNGDKNLIIVASNLNDEQAVSTLMHEFIEAINFFLKTGLEDRDVCRLETGLWQLLKSTGIDLTPWYKLLGR